MTATVAASFEQLTDNEIERFHPAYNKSGLGSSVGYNRNYKTTSTSTTKAFVNKKLAKDDASLLERSAAAALQKLHKSHSYSETLRPKATIIKQNSLNGRIGASLSAESDNDVRGSMMTMTKGSTFIIQKDATADFYAFNNNKNNNNKNMYANGALDAAADDDDDDDDSEVVFVNTATNDERLANDGGIGGGIGGIGFDDDQSEDACLLLPADSLSLSSTTSPTRRNAANLNSTRRANNARSSACFRLHAFITRNWYLSCLVPLSILMALMLVAYLTRDYAKRLLYWIETQNPWIIFGVFMLLFIIVSFPIVVGYFVLMITSGYLFGFFKGLPTVILGANVGIALAHVCIRSVRHRIPMHRLIKNETGRAILRVISGPRAFRVVLFTRLTPIPFGLQNAIFGVSSINPRIYHAATFLGLLPAQTINVYLGSTLRSMHEVLNSHGTAVTGYISFGIEVICGVALMFWVVQKARKELSETLLDCSSTDSKIINIQV